MASNSFALRLPAVKQRISAPLRRARERIGAAASAVATPLVDAINGKVHSALELVRYAALAVVGVILAVFLFVVIFVGTLSFYSFLYRAMVPQEMRGSRELFFDFSAADRNPVAHIDLASRRDQWSGAALLSAARAPAETLLRPGFDYDFDVTIDLPGSAPNQAAGMFMVTLDLLTTNGTVLAHSKRPLMLPWRSLFAHAYQLLARFVALFFWRSADAERIHVPMVNLFHESATARVASARVTLSDSEVQVTRATLEWAVRLRGLSYFLHHWWFTSLVAFAIVGMGSAAACTVVAVAVFYAVLRQGSEDESGSAGSAGAPQPSIPIQFDGSKTQLHSDVISRGGSNGSDDDRFGVITEGGKSSRAEIKERPHTRLPPSPVYHEGIASRSRSLENAPYAQVQAQTDGLQQRSRPQSPEPPRVAIHGDGALWGRRSR